MQLHLVPVRQQTRRGSVEELHFSLATSLINAAVQLMTLDQFQRDGEAAFKNQSVFADTGAFPICG
jgi:hypothetical protein